MQITVYCNKTKKPLKHEKPNMMQVVKINGLLPSAGFFKDRFMKPTTSRCSQGV